VKVLEALAAGKAVVASARAAEGIAARPGEDLLIADGDAQTARAVGSLLADPGERRAMGERARTWALRELGWARVADRYDELYARLLQPGSSADSG
jgi:glycosyltransferase involved in cell wall biosynthesis